MGWWSVRAHGTNCKESAQKNFEKCSAYPRKELHTTITEIEATINSRPLCYVYSEEVDNVLTPSHLIIGKRISNIPDPDSPENAEIIYESDTPSVITERMNFLATILRQYWTQWKHHYLTGFASITV